MKYTHLLMFIICTNLSAEIVMAGDGVPPTLAGTTYLMLPGEQWKLIFDDEFNGNHLDPAKWNVGLSWIGDDGTNRHHNSQYASYIANNDISVHDGWLDLMTRKVDVIGKNGKVFHYTEGFIQTDGKFQYQYGYCEIRAKVPADAGIGLWPAFWLQDHGWPPEDDVAEFWTGRPQPHFHQGYAYRAADGSVQWNSRHRDEVPRGWHTYGMEWGPGYQIMNMDDQPTYRIFGPQVTNRPMYLMLNSGVASDPLPTDKTIFPNSFLVDYVRVYSRPLAPAIHDGDFELEGLTPWWYTKGDVRLTTAHSHGGSQALQLTAATASFQQRIYGLKLNTTYQISAWIDAGGGTVKLGVNDFAAAEQSASITGNGYQLATVRFKTTRYVASALLYGLKSTGDNPAFVDDVIITEIHGE